MPLAPINFPTVSRKSMHWACSAQILSFLSSLVLNYSYLCNEHEWKSTTDTSWPVMCIPSDYRHCPPHVNPSCFPHACVLYVCTCSMKYLSSSGSLDIPVTGLPQDSHIKIPQLFPDISLTNVNFSLMLKWENVKF